MSDSVKLSVSEPRSIPEGENEGRIAGISTRDKPYAYVDLHIDVLINGEVLTNIDVGYPAKITKNTYLGELLSRFGVDLDEMKGQELDLADILQGEAVIFDTYDEKTERGTYAKIDSQSVRPHPTKSKAEMWGLEEGETLRDFDEEESEDSQEESD